MKLSPCERQSEVVAASGAGVMHQELEQHLAVCQACSQTQQIATLMRRHAVAIQGKGQQPPPASYVWRKAQARKQKMALRRATRSLVWMQALGAAYVTLLLAWCLRTLWLRQGTGLQPAWEAVATGPVLLGLGVAFLATVGGAGCLLLLDKRDHSIFVST